MRLRQALHKYSADQYKRSELVKGRLVIRRLPYVFSKQGFIEKYLRDAISDHASRYDLGTNYGGVGLLIDTEREAPTLRCSAITLFRDENKIKTGQDDFITTPPNLAIEFINQPDSTYEEYFSSLIVGHDHEDSDTYWQDKVADYQRFGVGRLWIIDLTAEVIHEFRQPDWKSTTFKHGQIIDAGKDFPGFRWLVEDIFSIEKLRTNFAFAAPLNVELVFQLMWEREKADPPIERSVAQMQWEAIPLEEQVEQLKRLLAEKEKEL